MTKAETGVIPLPARECKELGEKHGTEPPSCLRESKSDFGSLSVHAVSHGERRWDLASKGRAGSVRLVEMGDRLQITRHLLTEQHASFYDIRLLGHSSYPLMSIQRVPGSVVCSVWSLPSLQVTISIY